jgi:hypothetical protein
VNASTTQTVSVQLADFDGDGHLDVLKATDTSSDDWGEITWGDGSGGFSGLHLLPTGSGSVVDLDADGRPDFVRTVAGGDAVEVFVNRWDGRPD